jgi:hypothetical protein
MTHAPATISRGGPRARFTAFLAVLASLWLFGWSIARAAEPAELERLIRQGNEQRQKGSDQAALPYFQRAYDLEPSPRTAAQLGLVELALGYSIRAEGHLSEALASPHHLWVAKNHQQLETALAETRKAIGRVEITGSPVGATVLVNANAVGTLPLSGPVKVSEGRVQVVVKAVGFEEQMVKITVAGGGNERVSVDLVPTGSAQRAVPPSGAAPVAPLKSRHVSGQLARKPEESMSAPAWVRPVAWVSLAVAAGGFGFAGVNFVRAKQDGEAFNSKLKNGTFEHVCDAGVEGKGSQSCANLASAQDSAQRLGYAGLTVGLMLGTSALIGFLWSSDSPVEHVALSAARDGFAANWSTRF